MTNVVTNKIYKRRTTLIASLMVVGLGFVAIMNLDEATSASMTKGLLVGAGCLGVVFTFGVLYTYVALSDTKLVQRQGAFFWRTVAIADIKKISFEPRYRWPLNDILYVFIYTDDTAQAAMAINPNSYSNQVMSEMLNDIKRINPQIEFDKKSKELILET